MFHIKLTDSYHLMKRPVRQIPPRKYDFLMKRKIYLQDIFPIHPIFFHVC